MTEATSPRLNREPITEREDALLRVARNATIGLAMHAQEGCDGCKQMLSQVRAALAAYLED